MNESNESQSLSSSKQLMREKIEDFGRVERLTYKADVIDYWKENKTAKPELFELAQILMAVPATQVCLLTLLTKLLRISILYKINDLLGIH